MKFRRLKIYLMISLILSWLLIAIPINSMAGDAQCIRAFYNTSCAPSGSVNVVFRLAQSVAEGSATYDFDIRGTDGMLTFQPVVTMGTFTFKVYFSNDGLHWGAATDLGTGVTSSFTPCYNIDPDGPHGFMKIEAVETGGSGSPVLSGYLCSD